MQTALLHTRLYLPPPRPDLVPRPRLIERLNAGLAGRLTLISAPAGFGKTTLAAKWLTQLPETGYALAWLSLDEHDNHPALFLRYLMAALKKLEVQIEADDRDPFQAAGAFQPETTLVPALNQLAGFSKTCILTLDDYHFINEQQIHHAVSFILNHSPPNFHLILLSRADPPLPLARLRAQRQLSELRAADLRFTADETSILFEQLASPALNPQQITALQARTEGWIAGLHMAAHSLKSTKPNALDDFIADFTGSNRYVVDFLTEEVLTRQPEAVRHFLLRTALLERFTADLCNAVTGQDDGRQILDQLDKSNLFLVQLDENRRWYRYHHLFAEFLRAHAAHELSAQEQAGVHTRASHWYEANGFSNEAVEHALAAQDWGAAVRLIHSFRDVIHQSDQYQIWQRWFAALPEATLQENPDLCLKYAWALTLGSRAREGERPLALAEKTLLASGEKAKLGEVYAAQAFLERSLGKLSEAISLARNALLCLPQEKTAERYIAAVTLGISFYQSGKVQEAQRVLALVLAASQGIGNVPGRQMVSITLGLALADQGQLRQAQNIFAEAATRIGEKKKLPFSMAQAIAAAIHYEWNQLEKATELWQMWADFRDQQSYRDYFPLLVLGYAKLQWARGETQAAFDTLDWIIHLAQRNGNPIVADQAEAQRVNFWLLDGDHDAALGWLHSHPIFLDRELNYIRQTEYLARLRVLIHQATPQSLSEAGQWLAKLRPQAVEDGRAWDTIRLGALEALRDWRAGQREQAVAALEETLIRAEPEGYVRTFLDEGPQLVEILRLVARRSVAPDYAARLLAAGGVAAQGAGALPQAGLIEPLSQREIEVLRLLAAGQSNPEIARNLILSLHTVRTHVKNIYRKLGVNNRVQAIEAARQAGVL